MVIEDLINELRKKWAVQYRIIQQKIGYNKYNIWYINRLLDRVRSYFRTTYAYLANNIVQLLRNPLDYLYLSHETLIHYSNKIRGYNLNWLLEQIQTIIANYQIYKILSRLIHVSKKAPSTFLTVSKPVSMASFIRIPLRLLKYSFILALIILPLGGALYVLQLDYVVRSRFDGKRWSLPARVYARPLELYVGRVLTPDDFQDELERLSYNKAPNMDRAGSFKRQDNSFLVHTRAFRFWDGEEPAHVLDLLFDAKNLLAVKDAKSGQDLSLVRLDSVRIGSIYPTVQEDRILIHHEDLPSLLVKTLLAIEDRQFYSHYGIDPIGIIRAMWTNFLAGHVVQGGSTLTQQLVKNFYLTNERSMLRKINEALMALTLDLRYTKEQILETYANEIYLGQDGSRAIHGFGLASHFLFQRDLADLDLPRIALLVGIIKGPSFYDPRRNPKRARIRRDLVLDALVEQNIISEELATKAKKAELGVSPTRGKNPRGRYHAFMELVRKQLRRDYKEVDLQSEGLSIFTTLDPLVQDHAETGIEQRLPQLERSVGKKGLEAAAIIASSDNGEILALVGGHTKVAFGFNRALDAVRSIGSLVKPLVYLEALNRPEYTLFTPLADTEIAIKNGRGGRMWKPRNYDLSAHGMVPLFRALASSYNLATVNLGLNLGLPAVIGRLHNFGVSRHIPEVGPILLGAVSMTPLEVTQMYQGIASGGFLSPLRTVREVLDSAGKPLSHYSIDIKEVADPQSVWLLTWAMQQVVERGTARDLYKQLPRELNIAGKTGTTDNYRDSWFAGFTGDKVAVVWVGRDDNASTGLSGSTGAMQVWAAIIKACDNQPWNVPPPEGIILRWVDQSGHLVGPNCPGAYQAPFRAGTVPQRYGACGGRKKAKKW